MIPLSPRQDAVATAPGSVLVTACPGSGKTRVLTHRVLRALRESDRATDRVLAVTFTVKAAEEIRTRVRSSGVDANRLVVGTIHSFVRQWVLRPFAGYIPRLRRGFQFADEKYADLVLEAAKRNQNLPLYENVVTGLDRHGRLPQQSRAAMAAAHEYRARLEAERLVDHDLSLYLAYVLLCDLPETAENLASIFRVICVDEYQDTHDLQYGILGRVVRAGDGAVDLFIVGDPDQAIYASLGGVARTSDEIRTEFELPGLSAMSLEGCYRSTQRLIDYYSEFRSDDADIASMAAHRDEEGAISFRNHTVNRAGLASAVSRIVRAHLEAGRPSDEICILAPRWAIVQELARGLTVELPDVPLNAPGLSPFGARDGGVWYKFTRLVLGQSAPRMYSTRLRWATETVSELEELLGAALPTDLRDPRIFLRVVNSVEIDATEGLEFVRRATAAVLVALGVDLAFHPRMGASRMAYFERAQRRLDGSDGAMPSDVEGMRRLFGRRGGVLVTTCHSVKGLEFETVICVGVLRGYIPNWGTIINADDPRDAPREARRLLHVIASRAKRDLHFIAESGRQTQTGRAYEATRELVAVDFEYDDAQ